MTFAICVLLTILSMIDPPSSMLDLALIEQNQLKQMLKQPLSLVSKASQIEFALTLFPISSLNDPLDLFFKNLCTYYDLRMNKKQSFEDVTLEVISKAKEKHSGLHQILQEVFKSKFIERFKKRIMKNRGISKPVTSQGISGDKKNESFETTERKVYTFGKQSNLVPPNVARQPQISQSKKTTKQVGETRSVSDKPSNRQVPLAVKEIKQNPTVAINNIVSQSGIVSNLSDQAMCFCGNHVSLIQANKEASLICRQCKKGYHKDCMKREGSSQICSYCHLKKLVPNRQTKKVLFVGVLCKGKKKHQITFNLTEEDLKIQYKIQIRCFRLKEGCQTSVIFPDAATFYLRNMAIKEFTPLHKQSSLKYRKDEPFYLVSGTQLKENKLTVVQKHPSRQTRDERIQLENHLIGVYLIEELKVDWLIRQMKINCFTTFNQSKSLLDSCFRRGSIGDQVSCEIIKTPLYCPLTTEKLSLPTRGVLCTHFNCFDLKNFLQLTAQSANPRWLCPLCKAPTYDFKIDNILFQILQLHKDNPKASEVVFLKTGEFKTFENDEKQCVSKIHNIYDLPIENMLKRPLKTTICEEEVPQKKKNIVEIVLQ